MKQSEWNKGGKQGEDDAKGVRDFKFTPITGEADGIYKGGLDRHADAFGDDPKPKKEPKRGLDYSERQGLVDL